MHLVWAASSSQSDGLHPAPSLSRHPVSFLAQLLQAAELLAGGGPVPGTGDRVSDAQASQQVRGQLLLELISLDEEASNQDHSVELVPRADGQDKAH